jgi:hypothetical protein
VKRLDALVSDDPPCIHQTGSHVFRLQPWISFENGFDGVSGGQHGQDMFNRETVAPDDRFASKYLRVHGDSLKKLLFIHRFIPNGRDSLDISAAD